MLMDWVKEVFSMVKYALNIDLYLWNEEVYVGIFSGVKNPEYKYNLGIGVAKKALKWSLG